MSADSSATPEHPAASAASDRPAGSDPSAPSDRAVVFDGVAASERSAGSDRAAESDGVAASERSVGSGRSAGSDSSDRTAAPDPSGPAEPAASDRFESVEELQRRLSEVDYLCDSGLAGVVYLADRLGKPVLVEGPAGTGKTQLAKSVAEATRSRLIRLQCYEGLDEAKALYEWNYKKQLLRIQSERSADSGWGDVSDDIFSEEFLLTRPLLEAITAVDPIVLLIDEVDRVEVETEALLLEVLSEYQVSIPELGTLQARQVPLVFLTSNNTRELSEALKRRCLYLHIDYPSMEREKQIVLAKVPDITASLADQVAQAVRSIRRLELKKPPSVSETLDWARTLVLLGVSHVDAEVASDTINILLKYQSDIAKANKELTAVDGLGL
ncbi:MAG: AAA family ATPase [Acidimicrobiaceae bacterium]|nr:AAA family ATPase [Acidimicrobiaceae bacterium]